MTTFSYDGYIVQRDGGGVSPAKSLTKAKLAIAVPDATPSFSYIREDPSGTTIHGITLTSALDSLRVGPHLFSPAEAKKLLGNVEALTWSGGVSMILSLELDGGRTFLMQLSGARVPVLNSTQDYNDFLSEVTDLTLLNSGPYGPDTVIPLSSVTSPKISQNDLVLGSSGADWFNIGAGSDTVQGGAGADMASFLGMERPAAAGYWITLDLAAQTATALGGGTHRLTGIERVTGTNGADWMQGSNASEQLRGMGDYDWLQGSGGNDTLDGGNGRDTVSYSASSLGVTANLQTGKGTQGLAKGDSYISIENLTGSSHADRLTGDRNANGLRGFGGDDFIYGGDGRDTIEGGAGNDQLFGGAGGDRLFGGSGRDMLDGGQGWDSAIYLGKRQDYTLSTDAKGVTTLRHKVGNDGVDQLVNIEVIEFSNGTYYLD